MGVTFATRLELGWNKVLYARQKSSYIEFRVGVDLDVYTLGRLHIAAKSLESVDFHQ